MARKKTEGPALDGTVQVSRSTKKKDEPAAEWVEVGLIHPWLDNPRNNEEAVPVVLRSIKRFGFGAPILARRANGEIIAGHTRYKAARALGLETVPVRYLDLSESEAHLLALADNKTGELAEWDDAKLGALVLELQGANVDITEGTGFAEAEIQKLVLEARARMPPPAPSAKTKGDITPEPPALVFGKHRIFVSDEEASRLDRLLADYIAGNGSIFGFGGRLVRGL